MNKCLNVDKLRLYIRLGWPARNKLESELLSFFRARNSLDIYNECIFYGNTVFIPPKLRRSLLELIHREHSGVVKCKQLARSAFWWPNLDHDIEKFVKACTICQTHGAKKNQSQLQSWMKSDFPFERIHMDHYFFNNRIFLIIKDTIGRIVVDNQTAYTSKYFRKFCKANEIDLITTPPYHPSSIGVAEKGVDTVKSNLKKYLNDHKKI